MQMRIVCIIRRGHGTGGGLAEGKAMTSNLDVYRSAHALIQRHGEAAAVEAAMKADAMLDEGDLDGAAVWRRCGGGARRRSTPWPAQASSWLLQEPAKLLP